MLTADDVFDLTDSTQDVSLESAVAASAAGIVLPAVSVVPSPSRVVLFSVGDGRAHTGIAILYPDGTRLFVTPDTTTDAGVFADPRVGTPTSEGDLAVEGMPDVHVPAFSDGRTVFYEVRKVGSTRLKVVRPGSQIATGYAPVPVYARVEFVMDGFLYELVSREKGADEERLYSVALSILDARKSKARE